MPQRRLSATLAFLVENFADAVVDAIRALPLEQVLAEVGRPRGRYQRRDRGSPRLARRSSDEIGTTLDRIHALVNKHPNGIRAEETRASLGLQRKELPRPIAEGLRTGRLRRTGTRRATRYFAK